MRFTKKILLFLLVVACVILLIGDKATSFGWWR